MKSKWIIAILAILFVCCICMFSSVGAYLLYAEYGLEQEDEDEVEDSSEEIQEQVQEEVEESEELPQIQQFEFSISEPLVAGSTLDFSGNMPKDASVKALNTEYFDKAVISGSDFDLYFNLFYEAYNTEYEVVEKNVVSSSQFGELHRYNDIASYQSSYGYTSVLSLNPCDSPGSPIGVDAPCGSGAIKYEDNLGESFFFLRCEYSSQDGLDSCDEIVATLKLKGERN